MGVEDLARRERERVQLSLGIGELHEVTFTEWTLAELGARHSSKRSVRET